MNVTLESQKPKPINLSALAENWPSPVVSRSEVRQFTGGVITPKAMANEDSRGTGIESRFLIGRKIVYPVKDFIAWLEARTSKPVRGKIGHEDKQKNTNPIGDCS